MKKLMYISLVLLLVGCTPNSENEIVDSSQTHHDELTTNIVQEQHIAIDSNIDDVESEKLAKIYDFVGTTRIDKKVNTFHIQFNPDIENGLKLGLAGLYNKDSFIVYAYEDTSDLFDRSIGLYHLSTGEYHPLIEFSSELEAGIYYYDTDIIVYKTYESDGNTNLHVFDTHSKVDHIIFEYYEHPETNMPVYDNYNDIAVLNGTIYFDDFEYRNNVDNIVSVLYSYRLSDKTLTKLAEDQQNPFVYEGELVAFGKNVSGHFKTIYSITSGKVILEIKDDIRDFAVVDDKIYAIINSETNHEKLYTVFQLKELFSDQVILSTKSPIYNLKTAQGYIFWDNYYESEFVFYNHRSNTITICNNIGSYQNVTYTDGINNLLVCLKEDLSPDYYTFDPK